MDNAVPAEFPDQDPSPFLRLASEIWTAEEYLALTQHLHNRNGPTECVLAWRGADGEVYYKRTRRRSAESLMSWNLATVFDRTKRKIAFAPYSKNSRNESRWGGMDFDAHDGDWGRARALARRAFYFLKEQTGLYIILEHSGKGFHLWVIIVEFRPVNWWVRLLKRAAKAADAQFASAICEIFPPDTIPGSFGKPMRAPGSYNPSTDKLGLIEFENCGPLIAHLLKEQKARANTRKGGERKEFISSYRENEDRNIKEQSLDGKWLERFAITKRSTRNQQMIDFAGFLFNQVSLGRARRYIKSQYERKSVQTRLPFEDHLDKFEKHWKAMQRTWLSQLSKSERERFDSLPSENAREAFRILRGWWELAKKDGRPEFMLSRDSLAERLETSGPGAGYIRNDLVRMGVLRRTRPYKPHVAPASYIWLL